MFQPILERLCQEFRVVTIDQRGTGQSDALPGVYRIRDHMEDARAVNKLPRSKLRGIKRKKHCLGTKQASGNRTLQGIEALGDRPVVLVGISRSSAVAIHFAATYPHLVEKLVVIGTRYASQSSPDRPFDPPAWAQRVMAASRAGDREQAFRITWETSCSEPSSRDFIEALIQMSRELPWASWENFFVSDPDRDLRPLLPTLQVPTLVLHGDADQMVPLEHGRYLADHIRSAQFYVLKGRCHVSMFTASAEFAQVVRRFVRTGQVV
jgi:pimeloyl-ACP methyl ester carboxylesterase